MGIVIGVIAAIVLGAGVATAGSFALVKAADPDTSQQVKAQLKSADNPQLHLNEIYGDR